MHSIGSMAAAACCAFLLSGLLTYLCVRVSARFEIWTNPQRDRWHSTPTPNTGGVGIFLSAALLYVVLAPSSSYRTIAVASAGIAILGFVDDRLQLRPLTKFCGQSIAAVAVIWAGVVFHLTGVPFFDIVLTFLWITGITNAFNLIDNMDGLCAGVTVIICAFRLWPALESGDSAGAACLTILGGSFLGFLVFNYKPAKIFMGDVGSMFAGFVLASLAIAAPVPQTRVFISVILCPALTFLYPIFDTVLVSVLRRLSGTGISVGGRDHSSHRLASLGLKEERVVWLLWALAALGAAGGLLSYSMPIGIAGVAFFLMLATGIFAVFLANLPGYELPAGSFADSARFKKRMPLLRSALALAVDALIAGASLSIVLSLEWGRNLLKSGASGLSVELAVALGCQLLSCLATRTFKIGWRWVGVQDVLRIQQCALASATLSFLAGNAFGLDAFSGETICVYGLVVFVAMTGSRTLLWLLWRMLAYPQNGRRAAILGAGQTTESIVFMLRRKEDLNALPAVILETDPARAGLKVHGVPVLWTGLDPLGTLRQTSIDVLILSADLPLAVETQAVLQACDALGIPIEQFECRLLPLTPTPEPDSGKITVAREPAVARA